jgi:hypothetical protein
MAASTAKRSFAIFLELLEATAFGRNSAGFDSSGNTKFKPFQRKHSGFLTLPWPAMNKFQVILE